MVFRSRAKYVQGDFRFRRGYSKNPRKLVRLWAEKEYRNLHRLYLAKLPCPRPLLLRTHILVMEFLGERGRAAPKLKDADLDARGWARSYEESFVILHAMFHHCRLVHGDFSEYNLVYHQDKVFVIDVGQAVGMEHPFAMDFLRKDIVNTNNFFHSKNVPVLPVRSFFDLVVSKEADDLHAR
eukprot:CAMPEP_0177733718 /NCGR_PEP_ID=MMETSP0484_2-20121128/23838_1 /TAXON_ID=354590 /ORGANISM="Rhodomonas lens, Strain RHODO" /LENGTH=181 /DNA_ID=CAMNT_0019247125 /DNA_START=21 /DNA_END=562 /DNA_ORIENTATION=-